MNGQLTSEKVDYRQMHTILFIRSRWHWMNCKAIIHNYGMAETILQKAQMRTEELYIGAEE